MVAPLGHTGDIKKWSSRRILLVYWSGTVPGYPAVKHVQLTVHAYTVPGTYIYNKAIITQILHK